MKAATVKKHAPKSEEEYIPDVKSAARCVDLVQECLQDVRWTRVFLQTLSHALYVSEQPFLDWSWGSCAFRKTVQDVFDLSFPNISYTVSEQDEIMKAVCHVTITLVSLLTHFLDRPLIE